MKFHFRPLRSLRTRITLFTLGVLLISIWGLSYYGSYMLRQDLQALLSKQQFSTASIIAADVDNELSARLQALNEVAVALPPGLLRKHAALQVFLEQRPFFSSLFSGGVFATGLDGTAIASVADTGGRIGVNFSDRDYIQNALQGKAWIGQPVMGRSSKVPMLGIAVPIRDGQGQVIGALTGAIRLDKADFFERLNSMPYGKTGGYFLVAPQRRLVVASSYKNRVMAEQPAPGVNPMIDRFVAGYEGTDVYISPLGVEVLGSVKRIPSAGWYVSVAMPTAEAFAPIKSLRQRILLVTVLLTALVAALSWWMLRRQLAPLQSNAKILASLSKGALPAQPLVVARRDEIGQLIVGFNSLLQGLQQRENLLTNIFDTATVAIFVFDKDRRITQANQCMAAMFGCPLEQLLGSDYLDLVSVSERDEVRLRVGALLGGAIETARLELLYLRPDQSCFWGQLNCKRFTGASDAQGSILGMITDITDHKQSEEKIKRLAFYDPLTDLPNRRLLLDRLKHALTTSVRHNQHGALLFIDLDDFKTLNDTMGHDNGDLLLNQAARRLVTCVRDSDTVARFGGDEFVVMLEELNSDTMLAAAQAESVGEKILSILSQPYPLAGYQRHITCSIGITLFGDIGEEAEEPLKRADLAMYQAKTATRNSLRFFDPQMQSQVTARATLEMDMRAGLQGQRFVLYYQPKVNDQGRITGAEALVRWNHPVRGMELPANFIALAEETGLILPLGQWVLQDACNQLTRWAQQPALAGLQIAVNVSARQFHHADFVAHVLATLERSGARPQLLRLELTESVMLTNVEEVIVKMQTLKELGISFAMDDFGTGYSSLHYLKRLPLDELKIDQSFVRDILLDPNDAAIAKMVIALAHSMDLAIIAEGVETEEQRSFLSALGCRNYQGYLFGRPAPAEQFEALVAAQ